MQKNNDDFTDNNAENPTCAKIKHQTKKRDIIGNEYNLNSAKVAQYVRIADLCTELLNLLDDEYIAFSAAYQLTFIDDEKAQKAVAEIIKNGVSIDAAKAYKLREFYEKNKKMTDENIKEILAKRPKKSEAISIKPKDVSKFFKNGENHKQVRDTILEILEMYYSDYITKKQKEQGNE